VAHLLRRLIIPDLEEEACLKYFPEGLKKSTKKSVRINSLRGETSGIRSRRARNCTRKCSEDMRE
jgi:hypothetical protein